MPRLCALVRSGQEAVVLAYEHHDGPTLATPPSRLPTPSSAGSGTTCSGCTLTGSRTGRSPPTTSCSRPTTRSCCSPRRGDVAATDLQIRLDLAQLMAELALLVGPDRSADLAMKKIPADEMISIVPLLQTVALARSTREALRRRRDVLPALRKRLLTHVPGGEVRRHLERIRLRTLVTLFVSVVAAYLLAGELARASIPAVLRSADWRWGVAALACLR